MLGPISKYLSDYSLTDITMSTLRTYLHNKSVIPDVQKPINERHRNKQGSKQSFESCFVSSSGKLVFILSIAHYSLLSIPGVIKLHLAVLLSHVFLYLSSLPSTSIIIAYFFLYYLSIFYSLIIPSASASQARAWILSFAFLFSIRSRIIVIYVTREAVDWPVLTTPTLRSSNARLLYVYVVMHQLLLRLPHLLFRLPLISAFSLPSPFFLNFAPRRLHSFPLAGTTPRFSFPPNNLLPWNLEFAWKPKCQVAVALPALPGWMCSPPCRYYLLFYTRNWSRAPRTRILYTLSYTHTFHHSLSLFSLFLLISPFSPSQDFYFAFIQLCLRHSFNVSTLIYLQAYLRFTVHDISLHQTIYLSCKFS